MRQPVTLLMGFPLMKLWSSSGLLVPSLLSVVMTPTAETKGNPYRGSWYEKCTLADCLHGAWGGSLEGS